MTDATPQTPPAAASEPAKPATTAPHGAPVPASSLGGQRSPVDLVREHQSTIVVVLALVVAALAVVMIKKKQQTDLDGRAWEELTNLRQSKSSGTDGFSELAARYKGTSADPFIRIAWAARLYEGGKKDQVTEAKELLEQVVREHPGNPFVRDNVPLTLKKYEEELKDPKVHWAPATTTAAAGPPSPEAPLTPPGVTEPPK
jgi:hypothetical protein